MVRKRLNFKPKKYEIDNDSEEYCEGKMKRTYKEPTYKRVKR